MGELIKVQRKKKHLPAAVCTEDMYAQVKTIADEEEVTMSAVIRHALAFFFESYFVNSKVNLGIDEG